ncbi:hypothetical protein ACIA6C_27795 [Streptomyces sp. NPDC051578]|uniref:hypothetical protein n=1 Tax=Streptomyces sp. NPDC051578 TaxID=3365662 RepID=UPI0037953E63
MSHIMPASSGDTNPTAELRADMLAEADETLDWLMGLGTRDRNTMAGLLENAASGWIHELHDDDCDDDACTGCADAEVGESR